MMSHVLAMISIRTMARTDAPATGLVINASLALPETAIRVPTARMSVAQWTWRLYWQIARWPGSLNSRLTERFRATPVDELSPIPIPPEVSSDTCSYNERSCRHKDSC
jgi:hypothetical protein